MDIVPSFPKPKRSPSKRNHANEIICWIFHVSSSSIRHTCPMLFKLMKLFMYARLPAKFWRGILIGTYLRPQRIPGQHIKSPFMGSINSRYSTNYWIRSIFVLFLLFYRRAFHNIWAPKLPTTLIFSARANEFEISADYESWWLYFSTRLTAFDRAKLCVHKFA